MNKDFQKRDIPHQGPPAAPEQVAAAIVRTCATPVALRALAFVWVVINVYYIAVRMSQPSTLPTTLIPAAAVTILTSWAAIEGKRWGWMAMVFLVVASLADLIVGFALVTLFASASPGIGHDIVSIWKQELAALGLGLTFGAIVIVVWIVSLAVLMAPGVRRPIFIGKREHLNAGQILLAAVLLGLYVMGLASVGSTASASRILRSQHLIQVVLALRGRPQTERHATRSLPAFHQLPGPF